MRQPKEEHYSITPVGRTHELVAPGREAMFWDRVEKSEADGCWHWKGGTPEGWGAGMFAPLPDGALVSVHRVAYMLSHAVRLGKYVRVYRNCKDKLCLNPDHLTLEKPVRKVKSRFVQRGMNFEPRVLERLKEICSAQDISVRRWMEQHVEADYRKIERQRKQA